MDLVRTTDEDPIIKQYTNLMTMNVYAMVQTVVCGAILCEFQVFIIPPCLDPLNLSILHNSNYRER